MEDLKTVTGQERGTENGCLEIGRDKRASESQTKASKYLLNGLGPLRGKKSYIEVVREGRVGDFSLLE